MSVQKSEHLEPCPGRSVPVQETQYIPLVQDFSFGLSGVYVNEKNKQSLLI